MMEGNAIFAKITKTMPNIMLSINPSVMPVAKIAAINIISIETLFM